MEKRDELEGKRKNYEEELNRAKEDLSSIQKKLEELADAIKGCEETCEKKINTVTIIRDILYNKYLVITVFAVYCVGYGPFLEFIAKWGLTGIDAQAINNWFSAGITDGIEIYRNIGYALLIIISIIMYRNRRTKRIEFSWAIFEAIVSATSWILQLYCYHLLAIMMASAFNWDIANKFRVVILLSIFPFLIIYLIIAIMPVLCNRIIRQEKNKTIKTLNNINKSFKLIKQKENKVKISISEYSQKLNSIINEEKRKKRIATSRAEALSRAQAALDSMVGLASVKGWIERWRRKIEYFGDAGAPTESLNLAFLGNPGTGKTATARLMADLMYGLGLLPEDKLVSVKAGDLVAGYIGQSAIRTRERVEEAMGGVLFVDEAYALANQKGSSSDFGADVVSELLTAMEDRRGEIAIVFAGYESDMDRLFDLNDGLRSRIPEGNYLHFEDYSAAELAEICASMLSARGFSVDAADMGALEALLGAKRSAAGEAFGNARGARNVADMLVDRQIELVASGGSRRGVVSREAIEGLMPEPKCG